MKHKLFNLIASTVSLPERAIEETFSQEDLFNATDTPLLVPSDLREKQNSLWEQLATIEDDELVQHVTSEIEITALKAGLFLIHDNLETSHQLSQSIQGKGKNVNGDYWHGIMHRREPDYSNAKYWFRRVGEHPIYPKLFDVVSAMNLPENSRQLLENEKWDAFAFIDFCETCAENPHSTKMKTARMIQWSEMLLLMEHCYHAAGGE
ncbi:hypothetical protein MNBD_PLANCTO02-2726 [hydrothermal vent metagenome]|uniref:Uncharacterized protein n=1 Tax=hydrothermal vent metagenome TaxID=652676 RepID=A0A3B1DSU9_9ZZZZ